MKASELIQKLNEAIEQHGDLEVYSYEGCPYSAEINEVKHFNDVPYGEQTVINRIELS